MGHHNAPPPTPDDSGAIRERRAYPRFPVILQGICSVSGGADEACRILDLSLGGAKVAFDGKAETDAKAFMLLPHLGLVTAYVTRLTEDGFGAAFGDSVKQRKRVQAYLISTLERRDDPTLEDRVFHRIVPLRRTVEIRRAGAAPSMARIRDVSRSGVAIDTMVAMSFGETVHIGSTQAEVVRQFDGGVAARFLTPLPPSFDATVIL